MSKKDYYLDEDDGDDYGSNAGSSNPFFGSEDSNYPSIKKYQGTGISGPVELDPGIKVHDQGSSQLRLMLEEASKNYFAAQGNPVIKFAQLVAEVARKKPDDYLRTGVEDIKNLIEKAIDIKLDSTPDLTTQMIGELLMASTQESHLKFYSGALENQIVMLVHFLNRTNKSVTYWDIITMPNYRAYASQYIGMQLRIDDMTFGTSASFSKKGAREEANKKSQEMLQSLLQCIRTGDTGTPL